MLSKEAQGLAKTTVEAIKKIVERQKCPGCYGKGFYIRNANHCRVRCARCKKCNGTGKLKWEWKPRTGQFVIYKGKIGLIDNFCPNPYKSIDVLPESGEFIPVLHWEDDIEPTLEGMGYIFEEPIRRCYGSEGFKCHCVISLNGKRVGWGWGKTRIESVYKAVIKLAKKADGEVKAENP